MCVMYVGRDLIISESVIWGYVGFCSFFCTWRVGMDIVISNSFSTNVLFIFV